MIISYDIPTLIAVERDVRGYECDIVPGMLVKHWHDPRSLGVAVSRAWGPSDRPMQVVVVWSRCIQVVLKMTKIGNDEEWRSCLRARGLLS